MPFNIVLVVGDNHGRGAVGCYGGGKDFETPHIDALAAEGVRFTRFFCSNAYCSGARATLLTGLLPSQHGVHSWLQDTLLDSWPADWYAVGEFRTLPVTLQARGYRTAHVGKWHLGSPWAQPPGFDSWVSFALGDTLDFYDNVVVEDSRRRTLAGRHIVDYFTEKAVERIDQLRHEEPFFLSVWYDGPYALPPTNLGPDPRNPYYERFAGREFRSVPRLPVSETIIELLRLERFPDPDYREYLWELVRMQNDLASLANFAAQCALVDEGVGRIVAAVDEAGLAERTLIVYTTDQGNLFGQHGAWGHATSFVPAALFDELMCIPLVCRQPGTIPDGRVSGTLAGQYDLAPTLTDWAGFGGVAYERSPGRSLAPVLRGEPDLKAPDAVFFEQEETRAIRTGRFSYWRRKQELGDFWRELGFSWDSGPVLYDMDADAGQTRNVAAEPAYASAVASLDARLEAFFDAYANPRYDLWKGGTAKGCVDFPQAYVRCYGDHWRPEAEPKELFRDPGA
jgi:arylsulfatase A-like enzyme